MNYSNGKEIKLGDFLAIGGGMNGVVVYDYGKNIYYPGFESWHMLERGILVKSRQAGVVHYLEPDKNLKLIKREKTDRIETRKKRLKKNDGEQKIKNFLDLMKKSKIPKLSLWKRWETMEDGERSNLNILIRNGLASCPVEDLPRLLLDSNDMVRFAAAERLRQHGGKTTMELAKNMLHSRFTQSRILGVFMLGQLYDPERLFKREIIAAFFNLMEKTKSLELRNEIILAFRYMNDPSVVPSLLQFMASRNEATRATLAITLSGFPYDKIASDALEKLKSDRSRMVRYLAGDLWE